MKYCVTVVFDNGLHQFASATPDQLYDVLKRNMLQMPRASFNQSQLNVNNEVANEVLYGCGSVMVIDPAVDLGVRPSDAIGSVLVLYSKFKTLFSLMILTRIWVLLLYMWVEVTLL